MSIVAEKNQDVKDFLYEVQEKKNSLVSNVLRERKNVLDLKIVVLVDVSGSISEEEFKKFMLQVDKIRGLSVVRILEFDTKVIAMYDYFKTPQNEVMRLGGGGGTLFIPVFEQAKKLNPDAILIMTDMENFDERELKNPGVPTASIITFGSDEALVRAKSKYDWIKNIGTIKVEHTGKRENAEEQDLLDKDMKRDNDELSNLQNEDDEPDDLEDEDEED